MNRMKSKLAYIIFTSMLLVTSCSKIEQPNDELEIIHPEGCTPVDIELFSPALTRAALNNDNIDYYYLIVDQADDTDDPATGSINGTTYDYVLKVKRSFLPASGPSDAYKKGKHNGTWGRWEVYEMIIDGNGKVVEGPKRSAPIYLYGLDRKYYNALSSGAAPDPTQNKTPNIAVTTVKWDVKDSEIFKVNGSGRIVLNDENMSIDLSSTDLSEIYANDLIYSKGGKEDIALTNNYVLYLNPKHQFSLVNFELQFVDNFSDIYNYKNSKGAEHESIIHSLDIKLDPNNPIEYETGFNLSTGLHMAQTVATGPTSVDLDFEQDIYHEYMGENSNYTAYFQLLVSPNQIAADAAGANYNFDIKLTTKKFKVDKASGEYTMEELKKDREFSFKTTNVTSDSFGVNKSVKVQFTIGDNYDY